MELVKMDANKLIGMGKDEAIERCKNYKVQVRVTSIDGEAQMGTCDYWPHRVNLALTNGKVTGISYG